VADESGKVKIAAAYVSVDVEADQAAVDATTAEIAEKLRAGLADAGKVMITADVDEESAIAAGELLGEAAQSAAHEVLLKANLDEESATAAGELIGEVAQRAAGEVTIKASPDDVSGAEAGAEVGEAATAAAQKNAKSGGIGMGTLIATGIAFAAPLAGAAIIAGVGAGFIGLAALADKSNAQIKSSWKNLTDDLTSETKSAANDLSGSLAQGLDTLSGAAVAAKPALDQIFESVKPDIPIVATGLAELGTNLLPGLTAAASNSQPVIQGTTSLLSQLGTTGSDMLTTLSGNARNFGAVMTSTGSIVHTAGNIVANVASDLGTVWGQNMSSMDSAVSGVGRAVSGLASGAVPVLSAGLNVVTTDISAVTSAIGPLTPALGGIATSALLAWGAFKGADLVTSGIKNLGSNVVDFGAKVENVSPKLGGLIGKTGIAASSIAGPLGQAVALGAVGLGIYADYANRGAISSTDMASASSALTAALNQTGGAVTTATTAALKNTDAWKALVPELQQAGISQDDAIRAIEGGGPALDALNTKLGDTGTGQHNLSVETKGANTDLNNQSHNTSELKSNLDSLHTTFAQAVADAKAQADATKQAADAQQLLNIQAVATGGINFAGPLGTMQSALAGLGNAASNDTTKVTDLSNALQALINPGGAAITTLAGISTTEQGLADQLKNLKGPLTDANGQLDLNSTRGAAAATAIEGLSTNYTQYIAQAKEAGTPTATINANLQTQYDNLVKTTSGFTGSTASAKAYLQQLGILPPTAETTAAFNDTKALAELANLGIQTKALPDGSITVQALTADALAKITAAGYIAQHQPDGTIRIVADDSSALGTFNTLVNGINNRVATLQIHGVVTGVTGGGSITNILHATGGIKHATGGLTPVAPIAQIAPPSSFLTPNGGQDVFGDRPDVNEAYIPMDGSARSGALLDQVNAAMPGHGGGHTVSNTYAPTVNIGGTDPARVVAELQSEFSWYNMIGRAA
jgi:hypothetical protein